MSDDLSPIRNLPADCSDLSIMSFVTQREETFIDHGGNDCVNTSPFDKGTSPKLSGAGYARQAMFDATISLGVGDLVVVVVSTMGRSSSFAIIR